MSWSTRSGSHVPTDVTFFEDGYATTRGATTRFISGEFRYVADHVQTHLAMQ